MTRPLTQRELALVATPFVAAKPAPHTRHDALPQFLIAAIYRGLAIGVCFALFVLLTDAFGIFTLVKAQAAPLTFALIFIAFSGLKFVGLSIAVAVGLLAYAK
jgi:hypothetical protein